MTYIQNLPPLLWTRKPLNDHNTYVFSFVDGTLYETQVASPAVALKEVKRAEKQGVAAYGSTFIPFFGHHGVFVYSVAGRNVDLPTKKNVDTMVKQAYDSVFGTVKTKPAARAIPVQIITTKKTEAKKPAAKKPEKEVLLCEAIIDGDVYKKHYKFIANEELSVGDRRTAHLKSREYKGVTIVVATHSVPVSQLDHPLEWYVVLCKFLLEEHQLPKKESKPEPVVEEVVEEDENDEKVITVYSDDCEDEYLPE